MNARTIAYWVCTVFVALSFIASGAGYVLGMEAPVQSIAVLGYPMHFIVLLGVWKVVGGVVLLLPRTGLFKEWAYAGVLIDLTAAAVAHVAVGHEARFVVIPLVMAALAVASWWLRPAERRLAPATPLLA